MRFILVFFTVCTSMCIAAAELKVATGLPPVAYIVNEIGGDKIKVFSILPEGRSPHDYSPGPQDIRNAATAGIFLTTGMSFEKTVAKPLRKVKIIDVTCGVIRIPFGSEHNHSHDEHGNCNHNHNDHEAMDPHVWLSIDNVLIMAKNICQELIQADFQNQMIYKKNLHHFQDKMLKLKKEILAKMLPYKNRSFYVYHPAFGYYAHMTGLKQEAVEINGREATGKHLAKLIREAKENNVKTIFVQPQFNPAVAAAIARAISGNVAPLDPLAGNLQKNLQKITESIQQGFKCK